MYKYWLIYKLNVAEAFVYRATSFIWFWCDFAPSIVLIIFWLAIYQNQNIVADYSLPAMLLYYLGVMVISTIIEPHPQWWLKDQILSGQFASVYLLKPIKVFWERLAAQTAWRTIRLIFVIPAAIILFRILADFIGDYSLSLPRLGWLILALILSFIGQLFFKICLGLSAIWFGEIGWLVAFWDFSVALLGGAYFPLNLYPASIQTLSAYLPWRYFFYFPLSIFLGELETTAIIQGFIGQLIWVLAAGIIYYLVLNRGIKKYSAFGG